jgi:hypothetical protein
MAATRNPNLPLLCPYRRMVRHGLGVSTAKRKEKYRLWIQRASEIELDESTSSQDSYFGWPGLYRKQIGETVLFVTRRHGKSPREDLVAMCAQDIFIPFFEAVTKIIDDIGGTTKPRANNPTMDMELEESMAMTKWDGSYFVLNSQLHRIAEIFVNNMGSREEAYMCTIPLLSEASKLPNLRSAHSQAANAAVAFQEVGDWSKAADLRKWVCKSCDEEPPEYFENCQAELGELYRTILRENLNGYVSSHRSRIPNKLTDVEIFKMNFHRALTGMTELIQPETKTSYRYGWIVAQMMKECIGMGSLSQSLRLESYDKFRNAVRGYHESNKFDIIYWTKQMYTGRRDHEGETDEALKQRNAEAETVVLMLLGHGDVNIGLQEIGTRRTPLSFAAEIETVLWFVLYWRTEKADLMSPTPLVGGPYPMQYKARTYL